MARKLDPPNHRLRRSAGHLAKVICFRAGFILLGIIKLIAYRNACCKRIADLSDVLR